MASNIFMHIEGIPGEATAENFEEWIEVLGFSHGCSQQPGGAAGTVAVGKADHEPLTITKRVDKATPLLFLQCCKGKPLNGDVELVFNRAGGDKVPYLKYKLTKATILSARPGGSKDSEVPLEEIEFDYGQITVTFTSQVREDGTGGGETSAGWDTEKEKEI